MPNGRHCLPMMLLPLLHGTSALSLLSPTPPRTSSLPPAQAAAEQAMLRATLTGSVERDAKAMSSLFRGCDTEIAPTPAKIIAGALPDDLPRGALLRNGPNTRPSTELPEDVQRGGWLDGDAMVHCIVLPEGGADVAPRYSRTHLLTEGFSKEEAAGRPLFDGSLVAPFGFPLLRGLLANGLRASQPQKDTANTAFLKLAHGRVLALMEQCLPCELRAYRDLAARPPD